MYVFMQILFWDKKDFTILWKKFLNSFMLSFSGVEYVPLGNGVWIYNFSWDE